MPGRTWNHWATSTAIPSQKIVRARLLAAGGDVGDYAPRVGAVGYSTPDDVPVELRGQNSGASDPRWATERFTHVLLPPVTSPLPPLSPQPANTWRPSSLRELSIAEAYHKPEAWFETNTKDLDWMRDRGPDKGRPFKPQPLVLGQADVVK